MARSFQTPINMNKLEIRQLVLELIAGNPGSPTTGQVWFDTTANRLGVRGSAATYKLVRDGGDLTAGSVANSALTTNPLDRGNHTNSQLSSTISDFDTQVRTSRLDQMAAPTADVSLNSRKITGLADGVSGSDAINLNQLQAAVQGFAWKQLPVKVATTAAGTLGTSFANGQTVDGVTLVTADRILLKNQASAQENGIYTVAASGAPTRAVDADTTAELRNATVWVSQGTVNADTAWTQTAEVTTVGTTAQSWAQVGGGTSVSGGNGLVLTGSVLDVVGGTGIIANANDVAVDTAVVARWKTALIGNGVLTSITYNHALGNQWVTCQVVEVATLAQVECDVVLTDANNVTVIFAVAPASNAYRVIVVG